MNIRLRLRCASLCISATLPLSCNSINVVGGNAVPSEPIGLIEHPGCFFSNHAIALRSISRVSKISD